MRFGQLCSRQTLRLIVWFCLVGGLGWGLVGGWWGGVWVLPWGGVGLVPMVGVAPALGRVSCPMRMVAHHVCGAFWFDGLQLVQV